MKSVLLHFAKDTRGATSIEYGLIVTLLAVAIIGALQVLGGETSATFEGVANSFP